MRWRALIVALQLQWYKIACAMQTGIPDDPIVAGMVADPGRNFATKAVNWALRDIGKRNALLNAAANRCCSPCPPSQVCAR
jgi:hypothetical protein